MRSSNKSRSRNKSSNNRRGNTGNIVNRVFDSSGPDGRVRGTPQQIIEKYQSLARDAQLAGDRIGSENFSQHAEHYVRLLGEAQREINERREAMEAQRKEQAQQTQPQSQPNPSEQKAPAKKPAQPQHGDAPQPDIQGSSGVEIFPGQDEESNLVQTPENSKSHSSKPRHRAPKATTPDAADASGVVVEKPAPKRRKAPAKKPVEAADAPTADPAPVVTQPAANDE